MTVNASSTVGMCDYVDSSLAYLEGQDPYIPLVRDHATYLSAVSLQSGGAVVVTGTIKAVSSWSVFDGLFARVLYPVRTFSAGRYQVTNTHLLNTQFRLCGLTSSAFRPFPIDVTPTPVPSPTPMGGDYCGGIIGTVPGADPGLGILPNPEMGPAQCMNFAGVYVSMSGVNAVIGTNFGPIEVPAVHICFRPIRFGMGSLFGSDIDYDMVAMVAAAWAAAMFLLRRGQ
jgi:hypothetical protein